MASTKNIGDEIRDAVQSAVSSQDFSTLQATIESAVRIAADNIGKGIVQAQESYRKAQEQAPQPPQGAAQAPASQTAVPPTGAGAGKTKTQILAEETARRAQEQRALEKEQRAIKKVEDSRYAKTGGPLAAGVCITAGGAVLVLSGVPFTIASAALGLSAGIVLAGLPAIAGCVLLGFGVAKLSFISSFKRYAAAIGTREYITVEELAATTSTPQKKVLARLKKMIAKGYFKQGKLDDAQTTLMTTSAAYEQYATAREGERRRLRQERLADSVTQDPASPEMLTPEEEALLARGEAYIAKIRLSNEAIPGKEISAKIDQIEHVVRLIFKRASEHPAVIGELGQLMDYYLPTTVKLLDAYRDLDDQPIQGDNIQQSKHEIEGALDALAVAFEKLLDDIFRDMAWDVSSDVTVLHTVLAQEGLVDSPFAAREPLQAATGL